MPTSTDQLDAELRARRQAGGSPLKTVGMFGESARWRLCRYRHKRHTFAVLALGEGIPGRLVSNVGHEEEASYVTCISLRSIETSIGSATFWRASL